MNSWRRRAFFRLVFLAFLAGTFFLLYLMYMRSLLTDDFDSFDQSSVHNIIDQQKITFNETNFLESDIDNMNIIYLTILEVKNDTFTNYLGQTSGKDTYKYDIYFVDQGKGVIDNSVFLKEGNGEIQLKGKNPFEKNQKSFKIKLYDKEGLWNQQKILNLEKQTVDPLRIRNKLALDLIGDVSKLFSLKSRFIRLYIKDAYGPSKEEFIDYGLYFQVEDINKLYFANRGLASGGYLYEVNDFLFETEIVENQLEVQGDKGFSRLLDLLNDLNNYDVDIDEVVEEYFDKEHLLNWMAMNILIGNYDIVTKNYYLYSPQNSKRWYFIPSDCDSTFGRREDIEEWKSGVGQFYNNVLFKRIIRDSEMLSELVKTVDTLNSRLEGNISSNLDIYYDEFFSNMIKNPDFSQMEMSFEEFQNNYYDLENYPDNMYAYFNESIKYPLPFEVEYSAKGNRVILENIVTSDLNDELIEYEVLVSTDFSFANIIHSYQVKNGKVVIDDLEEGAHYIRVIATNSSGFSQVMANKYVNNFEDEFYGIIYIEIK